MIAFPDPAARSADEAAFLRAVLADLRDDHPKLVYADWLEDSGDPRGAFLRAFTRAARSGADLPDPPPATDAGWLSLTGVALLKELYEKDFGLLAGVALELARPAVVLVADEASDERLPAGTSKFNGQPDLPTEFPWPTAEGGPLGFLAQINLAEFHGSPAAAELPAAGLLSFFYAPPMTQDDAPSWRLVYTPSGQRLERRQAIGKAETLTCRRMTGVEVLSLPDGYDSPYRRQLRRPFTADEWDFEREDDYSQISHVLYGRHHLLGHPAAIQRDTLRSNTRRHLLTLRHAPEIGWQDAFCRSTGAFYFNVSAGQLASGRLDKPRFEMQCS